MISELLPAAPSFLCSFRASSIAGCGGATGAAGAAGVVAGSVGVPVRAAIEVIDSRVGAMRAKAVDSIADNAGAGRVVLGEVALLPQANDLAGITIEMHVDGETQVGMSGDVMGNPAAAVAWLANKLAEIDGLGGQLEAGDIVMSGSAVRSVAVTAGSRLTSSFGPFGTIEIEFT